MDFSTRSVSRRPSHITHHPSPTTERSLTLNLNRVDALSRLLARQQTRRRAPLLIGALLAAPWLGIDATQAGKKKKTLLKRGAATGACPDGKPTPPPVSPLPPGECTPTCDGNRCGNDDGCGGVCGCTAGSICHEGSCAPCTVTCNGDAKQCGQNLQAAITAGGTILICPGRYGGNFQIVANRAVLVGAGDGEDPAQDTILDGLGTDRTVVIGIGQTGELHKLRVTGGKTAQEGGGVRNDGSLVMTHCTVTKNEATLAGGGVYHHPSATGPLSITASTISDNTGGSGGGISAFGPSGVRLVDSLVAGNKSRTNGGGVESQRGISVVNTTIAKNEAIDLGGGMHVAGATVVNSGSVVTENTATSSGGGIYMHAGAMTLTSARVFKNRSIAGTGGGIYRNRGAATLNDSAVTDNEPDNCAGVTC